jgi:ABC-type transport system involved in cytochrome bd biosynthesis fused ATPase/permease subunit
MTGTNRKILTALLIVDGLLIFVSAALFSMDILLNTQIGFLSATLVMIGSMVSYRRMVDARVENEVITTDIDKDVIDKLEDPHDLYSEEVKEEPVEDIRAAIKEERAKLKANKRSLFEVLRDTKAALSLYRIGAYIFLVLGFMYLNRHGILHIPSYLFALSLPPLIIVILLVRDKAAYSEDALK